MSSVIDTTERAVRHTRGSLIEFGTQAQKLINSLGALETRGVDALLDRFGLQRRESALRPVMWFAAGAVVAGVVVFVLAPTAGKDLRERIAHLFERQVGREPEQAASATNASPASPAGNSPAQQTAR
jgi:hypothetical protein